MKGYKSQLAGEVSELGVEAGMKGFFNDGKNGGFSVYVDKQKTGVRVKLDFVLGESVTDEVYEEWSRLLKEKYGDLFVRVQRSKENFTHDSAGRFIGKKVTNVRVRLREEVRDRF